LSDTRIEPRYMSVAQAAQFLGLSEAALRNRVARGQVPFLRDGRSIRFDKLQLEKHMKSKQVTTDKAAA
jgi:excisionase family DNA binding protein